jgi:methylated-DNA-protein-cysteine methyltransferase-like protein
MPARYPSSGSITPVSFEDRVRTVLLALAPGDVVTYGEVAEEAGFPGAARAVGNVLRRCGPDEVPWWRVVAASGRLAPGKEGEQGRRLRAEGVEVSDGRVQQARRRRAVATPRPPTRRSRGR